MSPCLNTRLNTDWTQFKIQKTQIFACFDKTKPLTFKGGSSKFCI